MIKIIISIIFIENRTVKYESFYITSDIINGEGEVFLGVEEEP